MAGAGDVADRLESGWLRGTPGGDTVVRAAVLALAASAAEYARAAGGEAVCDDGVVRAYAHSPCAYLNAVVPVAPPVHWDALSVPPGLPVTLWSTWPTPDLRARRWSLVGHPPLMFRPAGARPATPDPAELEVTDVRDPDALGALGRTLVYGYPIDELVGSPELFPAALLGAGSWRFTLGRVDGEPVAASVAYVTDEVVLVGWVATLPQARRRGYGEAVTWRATLAAPDLPSVLLASDEGRPVYERMGYVALLRFTLWEHDAARS